MWLNDSEISKALGYSIGYMRAMKFSNRELYDHITTLGKGNRLEGYRKLKSELEELKTKIIAIYYEYKDTRRLVLADLTKVLVEAGIYKNNEVAYISVFTKVFNINMKTQKLLKKIRSYKLVIGEYNERK